MAVGAFQYFRPLPAVAATPVIAASQQIGTAPALPWPARGQAALFVDGLGMIGSSGGASPAPIASTAKIMTALLVLEDHPLAPGETGPVLTVTRTDVSTYFSELDQGESVVPVSAGEQLTEYQLLEGLLLPSGSNLAVMLATWDQGNVAAFVDRMNTRAAALGMTATHYADVSGFSPGTTSTPTDLIGLARTAMQLPVFAQIVAQPQATLPVAGVIRNLNTLLGKNGVIGIKTGHTDQAGGCLVFAADFLIDGRTVRVYGAVLGQPNFLAGALGAAASLLNALRPAIHVRVVVARGDVVGRYSTAWGESGPIIAGTSASWLLLDGTTIQRRASLHALPSQLPAGARVGSLSAASSLLHLEIPLVTEHAINGPDLGWRLTRGF